MAGEGHRLPRWIHRGCSLISAAARLRQQLLEAARSLGLRQEACAPVMVSSPVTQSSGCLSAVASGSTVRFRLCAPSATTTEFSFGSATQPLLTRLDPRRAHAQQTETLSVQPSRAHKETGRYRGINCTHATAKPTGKSTKDQNDGAE
jgi:hypothetical protein